MIHVQQGDSFNLLKQYEPYYFDYCLTSPFFKDEDIVGDYWIWFDHFIELLETSVRQVAFIFQSSTKKKEMYKRYGRYITRELIWGKQPSCYSYRYESIFVFLFNKEFKVNKYLFKDFWCMPPILNNAKTYENPSKLYREIVMLLPPGKIVDPFAGTGTLGEM